MYYNGAGVARDYAEAAKWARTSAEQGYAPAQIDFGYLYEQGKGVALDYVKATSGTGWPRWAGTSGGWRE
jgi:hypothetical protein